MALIIFGIPTVYFSLSDGKRSLLFTGAVIFFTGIVLWITAKYDVINTFGFIFTSILFITGGSFILLFIENTKQKIFLYSGLLLVFLAYFSTNLFKDWGIIYSAEVFFKNFSGIISIVLFLGGLFFFLFRERE